MIVFLDIDGTLVTYANEIPSSAVEAIHLARENGHQVLVNTGRSKAEISGRIWDIGIDGMIGANGGYVEYQGKVIYHENIPTDTVALLREHFIANEVAYYLECNSGLFSSDRFEHKARDAVLAYLPPADRAKITEDFQVTDVFTGLILGQDDTRNGVNKISYVLPPDGDGFFASLQASFPDLYHGTWGGHEGKKLFGDVRPAGITKAHAIHTLLGYLADTNEPAPTTVAFGDAVPDLPMFEACDVSVAMGNATDEVKTQASYFTDDVTADGLAAGFSQVGLI